MSTETKYDIFISYRRKGGSERAQLLNACFMLNGYNKSNIFLDVSTIPSGHFRKEITDALEVANNFVVVMSPGCFDNVSETDSKIKNIEELDDCYVYEIAKALQLGKNVIPVLFDGFTFDKETLPEVLRNLQFSYQNAVIYSRDYPEASYQKLLEFIRKSPKPTIWDKFRDFVKSHRKQLTITISISMAVILLFPLMSVFKNIVSYNSSMEGDDSSSSEITKSNNQDAIDSENISPVSNVTPFIVNGVSFDMVSVEGGTFTMGATSEQGSNAYDDEKPTHQVSLSDYMIGKTEVTQALWRAVMGNNPSYFKGDNLPVEQVSWNDCQEFVNKLNELTSGSRPAGMVFRLPTEAEWEYAARGGNMSQNYKYSGGNDIDSVAWHGGNSSDKTHAVAIKSPNELGLYDMSGNVWEWCYDWYGSCSDAPQTNPIGPFSGNRHVIRGVGWRKYSEPWTVFHRISGIPVYNSNRLGLRIAMSIDENKGNK